MNRTYYSDTIESFLLTSEDTIIGRLTQASRDFGVQPTQLDAWSMQIKILKPILSKHKGSLYFEFSIPRMGERIDVLLIIGPVIFVLEFKVGEKEFLSSAIDQVWDYALDLKNFHETSHHQYVAPILIATKAIPVEATMATTPQNDKLLYPVKSTPHQLGAIMDAALTFADGCYIDSTSWEKGRYAPTPTIIEAAMALYRMHNVSEITRRDASAKNLTTTTDAISNIIKNAKDKHHKSICFVTGVPGAGKTLIGLDIATKHLDKKNDMYSVFLSGNGPLVKILQEALARDKIKREKPFRRITKKEALGEIKSFIQNVHHYRDEYLRDSNPPFDHVALFDEAQRAWDLEQTASFMRRKKGLSNFNQSEPEFLISCIDRHKDWGVIICLVGGGQEINTGEAGIGEWINALIRSFPDWHIYISNRLIDSEYNAQAFMSQIQNRSNVFLNQDLHLGVSMRSFRAENVSLLVKQLLDMDKASAKISLTSLKAKYPICITRDLNKAKKWLRQKARGSERYGIVVSSSAERLRPHAIHVKAPMDPVNWFLAAKDDVRSSYYLEDVATEFSVQGLELDWACVTWDADFRYNQKGWGHYSFCGSKWNNVRKEERKNYLKNAYRVLLTRARQGMIIVVPEGETEDPTRKPEYYDPTFEYLKSVGFEVI